MSISDIEFDGEAIASGIARWASMESPSYDTDAVNRMMDEAAAVMGELGAVITRYDGGTQFGDIVRAHFPWGEGPGILVLGHLDTVHDIGTIEGELAVSRDGDRLYGPGVLDMKGGMYIAIEALRHVLKMGVTPRRPMTFMFIPDEEIGSPFSRPFIEPRPVPIGMSWFQSQERRTSSPVVTPYCAINCAPSVNLHMQDGQLGLVTAPLPLWHN